MVLIVAPLGSAPPPLALAILMLTPPFHHQTSTHSQCRREVDLSCNEILLGTNINNAVARSVPAEEEEEGMLRSWTIDAKVTSTTTTMDSMCMVDSMCTVLVVSTYMNMLTAR